ncbi:hypothetical protein C8F04DRAFT_1175540 [Mycena alexandri]|uniref:Uncharacterized protein n=1 Tax=Mycena alexandri TaxID=1745969 RepID=A0AAD6XCY1_9AGAR|nr:hypothetical protein C8F04DRAFT_1175540 [Mycena alexandri]
MVETTQERFTVFDGASPDFLPKTPRTNPDLHASSFTDFRGTGHEVFIRVAPLKRANGCAKCELGDFGLKHTSHRVRQSLTLFTDASHSVDAHVRVKKLLRNWISRARTGQWQEGKQRPIFGQYVPQYVHNILPIEPIMAEYWGPHYSATISPILRQYALYWRNIGVFLPHTPVNWF